MGDNSIILANQTLKYEIIIAMMRRINNRINGFVFSISPSNGLIGVK